MSESEIEAISGPEFEKGDVVIDSSRFETVEKQDQCLKHRQKQCLTCDIILKKEAR